MERGHLTNLVLSVLKGNTLKGKKRREVGKKGNGKGNIKMNGTQ
jgi:hypothetical protein